MAFMDSRGGRLDISLIPKNGWRETIVFTDASDNPVDITGNAITVTMIDGAKEGYGSVSSPVEKTYTGVVTDGPGGVAYIEIPASYFTGLYGEEVTYSVTRTAGGSVIPQFWGIMRMVEAV